jgi:hypothetical protein
MAARPARLHCHDATVGERSWLSRVRLAGRQQIRSVIGDHAETPVTPSRESAAVTVPAGR